MDYHTGNEEMDKRLDERFAQLNPKIQQLIAGDAIDRAVDSVVRRYTLTDEERNLMSTEIMLILMYMEPLDSLFQNLVVEDLIDPVVATALVDVAKRDIFATVTTELLELARLENEATAGIPQSQPAPVIPPTAPESGAGAIRPDDFKPIPKPFSPGPQAILSSVPTGAGTPAQPQGAPLSAVRVMPHTPQEAAAHLERSGTELPNKLLKNLQASLAHSAVEPTDTDEARPVSFNTILEKRQPLQ